MGSLSYEFQEYHEGRKLVRNEVRKLMGRRQLWDLKKTLDFTLKEMEMHCSFDHLHDQRHDLSYILKG